MARFEFPSPPGLEMTETYAKLRSDLEIRPESPDRDSSVIVKDPISSRFYRFTSVQATVLELLDGNRTPHLIASLASEKHSTAVLDSQVEDFVGKLQNLTQQPSWTARWKILLASCKICFFSITLFAGVSWGRTSPRIGFSRAFYP